MTSAPNMMKYIMISMINHDTTGILTHLNSPRNGIAHSALRTDSAKHRMASRGALDKFEESSFIEVWVPGQSERVDSILPSNRLLVVLNQIAIVGPGLPMVCPGGNVTMKILNF